MKTVLFMSNSTMLLIRLKLTQQHGQQIQKFLLKKDKVMPSKHGPVKQQMLQR